MSEPRKQDVGEWESRRIASGLTADGRILRGHAVVFHSLSHDLGGFRERILPSAVDRTLRESADVRALIEHDPQRIIGRTTAGTLTLRKDGDGLLAQIDPPDTAYARDLLISVERGDVTGMSFRFRVRPGGERWHNDQGIVTRDISDMDIREVSIVTFPAYDATDVGVALRSLDAFKRDMDIERRRRAFLAKGR